MSNIDIVVCNVELDRLFPLLSLGLYLGYVETTHQFYENLIVVVPPSLLSRILRNCGS
jgi:hypothetical protein